MKTMTLLGAVLLLAPAAVANAYKLTPEWVAKIEDLAPEKPAVPSVRKHTALLFSVMTGYKHWVTPHTAAMIRALGKKSGAFDVVESDDVNMLAPENIRHFDIIILNNTCSDGKKRNMFLDITGDEKKAAMLEESLIAHIAAGNGLVLIHGAITAQNNSPGFSRMVGGSFDFHPKQQEITGTMVDPHHPIVKPFDGKPFIHTDEPYLFKNAYAGMNFRPLIEMDTSRLDCGTRMNADKIKSLKRYIAWIKRHGEGRVFYCSPSHNARSFESAAVLRFVLNGIQYAAGDLKCDDSPLSTTRPILP